MQISNIQLPVSYHTYLVRNNLRPRALGGNWLQLS